MSELIYSVLCGLIFFCAFFALMSRHLTRLVVGLILISHAVNLTLLLSGGLVRGSPPFTGDDAADSVADPLPQALILTAIVITFALVAFALIAQRNFYLATGTGDVTRGGGDDDQERSDEI